MSNMSYCRFQNTRRDLADCQGALEERFAGEEEPLSREELDAAHGLVGHCIDILRLVAEQNGIDLDEAGGLEDLEFRLMPLLEQMNKEGT